VDDAVGWAERGLKISTNQSGQECDEGCGVILYNLGMLQEVRLTPGVLVLSFNELGCKNEKRD